MAGGSWSYHSPNRPGNGEGGVLPVAAVVVAAGASANRVADRRHPGWSAAIVQVGVVGVGAGRNHPAHRAPVAGGDILQHIGWRKIQVPGPIGDWQICWIGGWRGPDGAVCPAAALDIAGAVHLAGFRKRVRVAHVDEGRVAWLRSYLLASATKPDCVTPVVEFLFSQVRGLNIVLRRGFAARGGREVLPEEAGSVLFLRALLEQHTVAVRALVDHEVPVVENGEVLGGVKADGRHPCVHVRLIEPHPAIR